MAETTVTIGTHSRQPITAHQLRRALLRTLAAAPMAAAAPAMAAEGTDPHVGWMADRAHIIAAAADEVREPHYDHRRAIGAQIAGALAMTPTGIAAQV